MSLEKPKTFIQKITSIKIPKPWDTILVFVLNVLVIVPLFIILHQNLIDPHWPFHIDRILIFLSLVILLQVLLNLIKRVVVWSMVGFIFFLLKGTVFQGYGFYDIYDDYRVMIYSMSETATPQDIIVSKLLPFPNKSSILQAIEYNHPGVRNFALSATTKHFRNHKQQGDRRRMIQSFAIFKEIQLRWNYVNDPKNRDYIASASESLQHFSGDCEDHAILMSASIKAIGGVTRLIHTKAHIYPELLIGNKADFEYAVYLIKEELFPEESKGKTIHYHIDERGQIWINLDYTEKYPGGPFMSEEILGQLTIN